MRELIHAPDCAISQDAAEDAPDSYIPRCTCKARQRLGRKTKVVRRGDTRGDFLDQNISLGDGNYLSRKLPHW